MDLIRNDVKNGGDSGGTFKKVTKTAIFCISVKIDAKNSSQYKSHMKYGISCVLLHLK